MQIVNVELVLIKFIKVSKGKIKQDVVFDLNVKNLNLKWNVDGLYLYKCKMDVVEYECYKYEF